MSTLLLEFFNLITDYAERRPDLERDEDCFHRQEPDSWSATRRCLNATRGRVRSKRRRDAQRSAGAVVCAVLSALGDGPAGTRSVGCCTERQAGKVALQWRSKRHRHLIRTGLGACIAHFIRVGGMATATGGIGVETIVRVGDDSAFRCGKCRRCSKSLRSMRGLLCVVRALCSHAQ